MEEREEQEKWLTCQRHDAGSIHLSVTWFACSTLHCIDIVQIYLGQPGAYCRSCNFRSSSSVHWTFYLRADSTDRWPVTKRAHTDVQIATNLDKSNARTRKSRKTMQYWCSDVNKNKRKIRTTHFLQANATVMSSLYHCRLYSKSVPFHCSPGPLRKMNQTSSGTLCVCAFKENSVYCL
jgi:hypothetical protein